MEEYNENARQIAHKLDTEEVAKTFKLSNEAADKLMTLIDAMGLTLEDVKNMSLEEIQIRHGAYLLQKSQTEQQVETYQRYVNSQDKPLAAKPHGFDNGLHDLQHDLDIFKAKEERQKKQEEMAAIREQYPENYANRAERRRILRENKKAGR